MNVKTSTKSLTRPGTPQDFRTRHNGVLMFIPWSLSLRPMHNENFIKWVGRGVHFRSKVQVKSSARVLSSLGTFCQFRNRRLKPVWWWDPTLYESHSVSYHFCPPRPGNGAKVYRRRKGCPSTDGWSNEDPDRNPGHFTLTFVLH